MELAAYEEMRRIEDHHWWYLGRRRLVRPLLERALARATNVLDIGCGTGANLALVEEIDAGPRTVGLDFEPTALAFCRSRALNSALVRGDGMRLPFGDGSVDCITALDIVEHFDDDHGLLAEFQRVLAPGGEVVITVPQYPSLWSPHDDFLHHKRRYRAGELELRLAEAGFQLEERRGFNFLLLPPIWLVRRLKARAKARGGAVEGTDFFAVPDFVNLALSGLFRVESALVRVLPIRFGVSLMVRATKRRAPGA
ncbi:MAG: class I SAM-dependent methyltransferase [Planctomycetota bacterium]